MELLEYLRECTRCRYISDLHCGTNNVSAKSAVKNMDFSEYSFCEISDAINYVYGGENEFNSVAEVRKFLSAQ